MKIVVFGLSISSAWGNGHATLWRGLCRALARRGHRVVFFERDVPYYARHRDMVNPEGCDLRLYQHWGEVKDAVRRELADADVGMVTSYCPDALVATECLTGVQPCPVTAFYDMDAPVTLERLEEGQPVPYIGPAGLQPFDVVLSFTGGRTLDALRARLGARRVFPLYGSVDPDVHGPAAPQAAFAAHASHLGTFAEDRRVALERLFLEPARRLAQRPFLLAGALYPAAMTWPPNVRRLEHVPPHDHAAFYSSSRVTVNLTRAAMARFGYCPSGRLFEAAACATPLLSDPFEGLDAFFKPGEEIFVAEDAKDALAALELDEQALRDVGAAARRRVLRDHTADQRVAELEQMLAVA